MEQNKRIPLSQDKSLLNLLSLQGTLCRIWTTLKMETKSREDRGKILKKNTFCLRGAMLLEQSVNNFTNVRVFNGLITFVNDKKKVETMTK